MNASEECSVCSTKKRVFWFLLLQEDETLGVVGGHQLERKLSDDTCRADIDYQSLHQLRLAFAIELGDSPIG